jgi:hypothetical protein
VVELTQALLPGFRSNRPLRVIAVASSAPMRWRTSASVKWLKRAGSKGDVTSGSFFPDAIGAVAVGGFIAISQFSPLL